MALDLTAHVVEEPNVGIALHNELASVLGRDAPAAFEVASAHDGRRLDQPVNDDVARGLDDEAITHTLANQDRAIEIDITSREVDELRDLQDRADLHLCAMELQEPVDLGDDAPLFVHAQRCVDLDVNRLSRPSLDHPADNITTVRTVGGWAERGDLCSSPDRDVRTLVIEVHGIIIGCLFFLVSGVCAGRIKTGRPGEDPVLAMDGGRRFGHDVFAGLSVSSVGFYDLCQAFLDGLADFYVVLPQQPPQ